MSMLPTFTFRHRRNFSGRNRRKVTALFTPSNHQNLPTRWTRRVRSKPLINTSDMKSVTTLRQNTDLISVNILCQTNRTVAGGKLAAGVFISGIVSELLDRFNELLLNSFVSGRLAGSPVND